MQVQGLVPPEMENISIEEFMANLSKLDEGVEKRRQDALKEDKVLCFVVRISLDIS